MVKTGSRLKKESPKKSPETKIRETDIALTKTRKIREKKEKREELTELEQELLSKILQAYLAQYPLITKGKRSDKYAHQHKMAEFLRQKLIRMKLIPKDEEVKKPKEMIKNDQMS